MRQKRSTVLTVLSVWICPLVILLVCNACSHAAKRAQNADPQKEASKVPDEVSLTADRTKFAEMRTQEPAEVRKQNDELSLILNMMKPTTPGAEDEDPNHIRDRFAKYTRTKREANDKVLKARRDEFNKAEKEKREKFLAELKADREAFFARRTRATQPQTQSFYGEQEQKRQAYFGDERDRARTFESALSEERRTFEDSVREITNRFNEEHRNYSTAYFERKRAETNKKALEKTAARKAKEQETKTILDEFKTIPKGPATPLGAGEANP